MTRHALDYMDALERASWKHRIEDPSATQQTVVVSVDVLRAFQASGREWALPNDPQQPAVETIMGFPVVVDPTLPEGTLKLVSARPSAPSLWEAIQSIGEHLDDL